MKIILAFLLTLFSVTIAYPQQKWDDSLVGKRQWQVPPIPLNGNNIVYNEDVVLGAGYAKDQLINNVEEWYNHNYKTADTRLSVENKETGKISGTGVIKYNAKAAQAGNNQQDIFFSFIIIARDSSYSYTIYDIQGITDADKFAYNDMYREEKYPSTTVKPRWPHKYRYEILSDMDSFIRLMIAHLKESIAKK